MAFLNELDDLLRQQFDINKPFLAFDDKVVCHTYAFSSEMKNEFSSHTEKNKKIGDGELVAQNDRNGDFRYAVFSPAGGGDRERAIILLHGLNERSWDKYLTWAYNLTNLTRKPVVLFPLANHINRSPEWWSFPRKMADVVKKRQNFYGKIPNSSFVNAALSSRIDHCPQVFMSSGLQSISDIVKLTGSIRSGKHSLFRRGAEVDFFAYSIGALVTEVLLMANPMKLYSRSKAFFFCGGSTFDQMDGRSRSILDNRAFSSLREFVTKSDFFNLISLLPKGIIPYGNALIQSFSSLVTLNKWQDNYKSALDLLSGRVYAIGLKLDKVIPADAIYNTISMGGFFNNFSLSDFDFKHSHENPFPIRDSSVSGNVDEAFCNIFSRASGFLRGTGE
ncbi:DUF6051 family protein [Marinilabilia rubra]|uniref:Alpha/beta hydrolase n=1 Tax=Marinilabilia rubra TaxID=2162893 RepID=A0A2U2B7L2_9BACT|nr:DUF6051 family protein [Marinilabilia rubra]PWD99071.1 hypothetical protein DDZ16_12495 [Marinilabilia rubra]